ncbi:hypothetical protein MRB53_014030 [Persea americana]|uniref:Uncharacterized protein n=1 Tax=Persea americana TaxID=3435 RepID=A0ACC2K9N0_PERAE|nr:hypothetical protein MRB53_014030 [Persea americana]
MTGTFETSPMLSNLIELQWRVCDGRSLSGLYDLLGRVNLPCLKKLQLQWIPDSNMQKGIPSPSWHVFHHLKTIKMDGFYGNERHAYGEISTREGYCIGDDGFGPSQGSQQGICRK